MSDIRQSIVQLQKCCINNKRRIALLELKQKTILEELELLKDTMDESVQTQPPSG
jgi:hypothetical protein